MPPFILAGDIGGTKTNLALYELRNGECPNRATQEGSYPSARYTGLTAILAEFLGRSKATLEPQVSAAVFGIAGPIIDGDVAPTNLPWTVDDSALRAFLGTPKVRLMNDLETTAYGLLFLPDDHFQSLNTGRPRRGNRAVIAAGTGLGQAFLGWDGTRFHASATEGGHVDFAPRTDEEIGLLNHLRNRFGRVSYERVLSGPGLLNIFEYLVSAGGLIVEPEIEARMKMEDPPAVIGQSALMGTSVAASAALDLFISIYGAQAGNLALATMATGGLYVAGGIVTKILPRMTDGRFMRSFVEKGRSTALLKDIPVAIVLNPKASLVGAARAAAELL